MSKYRTERNLLDKEVIVQMDEGDEIRYIWSYICSIRLGNKLTWAQAESEANQIIKALQLSDAIKATLT